MPWASKAQARWGHSAAGEKALGGAKKVAEWDAATPKGSLPQKVGSHMSTSGIHIKPSHVGLLHKAMGVPKGSKISLGDLMETKSRAKRAGNMKLEKQATFAANARSWNKGSGKGSASRSASASGGDDDEG